MKYPQILKEKLKTEYWEAFRKKKQDPDFKGTDKDIWLELEETMEYYSSYGSFRKGLCHHRQSEKVKSKNQSNANN